VADGEDLALVKDYRFADSGGGCCDTVGGEAFDFDDIGGFVAG
jgi:hypothetical protein